MEKLLGKNVWNQILSVVSYECLNEIRIRVDRPILIKTTKNEQFIDFTPSHSYLSDIILVATSQSLYAHEKEISDGYLEYKNGIRIGLCGVGRVNDKKLLAFSEFYSVCIRIPHCIRPNFSLESLVGSFKNTLIIGPPFSGKTTLIRAIGNLLAEKNDVVFIDERKELAGIDKKFISAKRADIMQGIPKRFVFENIIRSMSPDIVICDELFSDEEISTVKRFTESGIRCLASFHTTQKNLLPKALLPIFQTYITLSSKPHPGNILSIVSE